MATVGWIKVGLSADTGQFIAGMAKAASAVDAFAKSARRDMARGEALVTRGLRNVMGGAGGMAKGLADGIGRAILATPIGEHFATLFKSAAAPIKSAATRLAAPIAAAFKATAVNAFVAGLGRTAKGLYQVADGVTRFGSGLAKLGLATAAKSLMGIGSSFAHVATGLASGAVKLAAVGAGAGAALFAVVKHAMNASDAVHDMARELGVSNQELGQLHHAAKVAGIDAGTLDNSLEKLNQNLGKIAQEGTGPAADALRRFGLSARQMADAGPTKAFEQSIDLLARIPNAAERAAVAVELFGKSGQAMIRLAGEGKGAVERLKAEAQALGVAISDVDSEKIGEANDALDRVWGVVQGLANSIAVALSPLLTYVADQFVDWAKEGTRAGSMVSQATGWVTEGIGYAADAVQVLTAGFHYMQAIFAQAISFILDGVAKFADSLTYLLKLIPGVAIEGKNAARELADAFQKAAIGELDKGDAAWGKKWAHDMAKQFVGEIQVAAQNRAQLAAGNEANFRKGGAFDSVKPKELGFGAATEMGSASAASAIAKARGQQISGIQNQIATASKTTAEATTRTAVATERAAQMLDRIAQGTSQGVLITSGM